jgi:hypothetical protein
MVLPLSGDEAVVWVTAVGPVLVCREAGRWVPAGVSGTGEAELTGPLGLLEATGGRAGSFRGLQVEGAAGLTLEGEGADAFPGTVGTGGRALVAPFPDV